MTDKEQIEKMAKDIPFLTLEREVFVSFDRKEKRGWILSKEDTTAIAEALYNAGYHKSIWHKVADDDLPKEDHEVIFVSGTGDHHSGVYVEITNAFYTEGDIKYNIDEVIAWTELPKHKE